MVLIKIIDSILGSRVQFNINTVKNEILGSIKYKAYADPWKRIWIDPSELVYYYKGIDVKDGLGNVKRGEWDMDRRLNKLEGDYRIRGIKQKFEDGKDWIETDYAKYIYSNWESIQTEDDLQRRFNYIENLYESIEKDGYIQTEKRSINEFINWDGYHYRNELEPLVLIGRDGEVILRDGFHRISICRILNVELPVNIVCRHKRWQLKRDELNEQFRGSQPVQAIPDVLYHPDMLDIKNSLGKL